MSRDDNAKLTIEDGNVVFRMDVSDFLAHVEPDDIRRLAQSYTFREAVFEAVVDRLISGVTVDGYWSGENADDIHERARLRLLESLPEVERKAVRLLIEQRERLRAECRALATWAWRTWHDMSRDDRGVLDMPGSDHRVNPPEWYRRVAHLTEDEVAAMYDAAKREVAR